MNRGLRHAGSTRTTRPLRSDSSAALASSSARRPRLLLALTAAGADRYVVDLIEPISPRPTRAAMFYEALPPWIEFLVRHSFVREADGVSLTRQVIRRLVSRSGLLETLIPDPVMQGIVRRIPEACP